MKFKLKQLIFIMLAVIFIFPKVSLANNWEDREDTLNPKDYSVSLSSYSFNIGTDDKIKVNVLDDLIISNISYGYSYGKEGDSWFIYPDGVGLFEEEYKNVLIEFKLRDDSSKYFKKGFDLYYTNPYPYNVKFYPEYAISGENTRVIGVLDNSNSDLNNLFLSVFRIRESVNIIPFNPPNYTGFVINSSVPSNTYNMNYQLYNPYNRSSWNGVEEYEVKGLKSGDRTFVAVFIDNNEVKTVEVKEDHTLSEMQSFNPPNVYNLELEGWYIEEGGNSTNEKFDFSKPVNSNVILSSRYKNKDVPIIPNPELPDVDDEDSMEKMIDRILSSKKFNDFIDDKLNDKLSGYTLSEKQLKELKNELNKFIGDNSTSTTIYVESEIDSQLDKILSNFNSKVKNQLKYEIKNELIKELESSNPKNLSIRKPYIQGYVDKSFKPDSTITRAEVAEIVAKIIVDNNLDNSKQNLKFTDVNQSDWFYDAVSIVTRNNIFNGYPEGDFIPEGKITITELIVVASRLAGLEQQTGNALNLPQNHWATGYVQSAKEANWLNLYSTLEDNYNDYITRGEVVYIMNRTLNKVPDKIYIDNNLTSL